MNKFVSFLFLVTVLGYCAMAGAKTTYFKSEVAGQDLPFSDAALVGDTLYISGKGGVLPGTRTVPEDPKEEARLLMEDFKTTLERVNMTMDDLVYVTVYCTDLSLYSDFNEVYRGYFSKRLFLRGPLLAQARFCLVCALRCKGSLLDRTRTSRRIARLKKARGKSDF